MRVHAMPDLRIAAGRLRDGFSRKNSHCGSRCNVLGHEENHTQVGLARAYDCREHLVLCLMHMVDQDAPVLPVLRSSRRVTSALALRPPQ